MCDLGLMIKDLEEDQGFQDLVLCVFHATTHTFSGTSVSKIIENHLGRSFILFQFVQPQYSVPFPISPAPPSPSPEPTQQPSQI